jgi:hypothetical protein
VSQSQQIKSVSIKSLYSLALAEGEGVGTAYEYFVKRLALHRWLPGLKSSGDILIAGLPEKYGASLDFLLLAEELNREVTIVDERPHALEKIKNALPTARETGLLKNVTPVYLQTADMSRMAELAAQYGFCISSEVMQRLPETDRAVYWQRLMALAPAAAVFAPNADNPAHTNLSGLAGLHLEELRRIVGTAAAANYIDMPPFPPGMTRTDEQREQATSGRMEAVAMWGLGWYARMERFIPGRIRRAHSHIVYALSR